MEWHESQHTLIKQLVVDIERHLPAAQAAPLAEFARQYYENFPVDELSGRPLGDLYAATYGSWHFLQYYDSRRAKVRVFNPEFERHGWQLGHTVVAIVCPNVPFALDSVRSELNSRNITIFTIYSISLRVRRDEQHQLQQLLGRADEDDAENDDGVSSEAFLYLEISRHSRAEEIAALEEVLRDVLREVNTAVSDYQPMCARARAVAAEIQSDTNAAADIVATEVRAFIDWILADNFTFLGYEKFRVEYVNGQPQVEREDAATLGLLAERSTYGASDLLRGIAALDSDPLKSLVYFSKSSLRARVHRRVYPDYIGIRVFDAQQRVIGEHRFLGLYTSRVYTMSPALIPLIRLKVTAVIERANFPARSHERSELLRVLEVHPRDELFQSKAEELFVTALAIIQIQERRLVRVFVRRDPTLKFINCLVYMPRDMYNTQLRIKIQNILYSAFDAQEAEFSTFFSESVLTRTHYVLRTDPQHPKEKDNALLEKEIVEACLSWQDRLRNHLVEEFGEEQGLATTAEYGDAFPASYRDDYEARAAIGDIRKMAKLISASDIAMSFYRSLGDADPILRFRLFHLQQPLPLSDVMPILDNFGLRALGERSYGIKRASDTQVWIHEFVLSYGWADGIDINEVKGNFQEAFARIWYGDAENDSFNKLILGTGLGWRDVAMLRAYARYLKQIQFNFSSEYIADTLLRHLIITQIIVQLFQVRFDPQLTLADDERNERESRLQARIVAALDDVENLGEDRIIRQIVALIKATLRCNYFQRDDSGKPKNYFSFKLDSHAVPEMPLPRPLYEIFVHSPRVEGIHLRTSKVARGGLRWSDRQEDFRTEVLGLVKAQNVKNAVIVPTGAKGGFVARRAVTGDRDAVQREGITCYKLFVQGLLDITDNTGDKGVIPPPDVVRKDADDIYLVVAADKGTASFSDIANDISHHYNFWLGDAFASGGSVGYDHKKMGITARGAWISVERHFREIGVDVATTDFTVVGIGDMAGDVFGNGMLLSRHIQLVGAFNHQHIFIDPQPNAEASFIEREHLFNLPRSSWEDYNATLISEGGGIFKRSAKTIDITPQMKTRFLIEADQLAPNELIIALLKAPIDLLWNGGIGTYVKASTQTNADCGDKTNDALRVDGRDLRCKVIGEGGNLGCTQLGRVEFALRGGRCNTDFIDNSAGVDCSDHEVNIKIALNTLLTNGDMTEKQRRELLVSMTDEVSKLVLKHNQRQTLALSLAELQALQRSGEYQRLIHSMEGRGYLNRAIEFIPSDDALIERKIGGKGLTRPELSVLISYTKGQLKSSLAVNTIADDPLLAESLFSAFPVQLRERYPAAIEHHRLRREIIATQIANDMIDLMGIPFVERMAQSTGATAVEIARAYVTAREIFNMRQHWRALESLPTDVSGQIQLELMAIEMRMVRRATRWFIRNRRVNLDPTREVERFQKALAQLVEELPQLIVGRVHDDYLARHRQLTESNVPPALAQRAALANVMYVCLGIIDATAEIKAPAAKVAEVYFVLGQELELDLFSRQIAELRVENHWQAQARESFRDDLEWQMRKLAVGAMRHICDKGDVNACIQRWIAQQSALVARWRALLVELHGTQAKDFAVYAVAIRELLDLAQSTQHDVK
ncbi:MAG: NAD-glutamate dehydrogenase [Verrucomicrobiaceae bacterium]|nr:NAD-glutamate dehydrogenase [Verrucomicrobiaceae bacterium]